MIWLSSYWKDELLNLANTLAKRRRQKRFSERSMANLEKELFFAFYAIRKLLEAKKLTQRIVHCSVPAHSYPSTGKGVTFLNFRFDIDRHFDFKRKKKETLRLDFLCNQVIHSYIYFPEFYGDRLMGILICSDRKRNTTLYSVKLRVIENILRKIASDDIRKSRATYDSNKGDYKVEND